MKSDVRIDIRLHFEHHFFSNLLFRQEIIVKIETEWVLWGKTWVISFQDLRNCGNSQHYTSHLHLRENPFLQKARKRPRTWDREFGLQTWRWVTLQFRPQLAHHRLVGIYNGVCIKIGKLGPRTNQRSPQLLNYLL